MRNKTVPLDKALLFKLIGQNITTYKRNRQISSLGMEQQTNNFPGYMTQAVTDGKASAYELNNGQKLITFKI